MAGAHQYATVSGAQRKYVTRCGDVGGAFGRVYRHRNSAGPVMGRNAGRHPFARLDRDGEGGLMARRILGRHQRQTQCFDPLGRKRQTNQPAPMHGHEVDRLGGGHLCGDHQIPFVFAVLMINKDEHASVARFLDDFFGWGNRPFKIIHCHMPMSKEPPCPPIAQARPIGQSRRCRNASDAGEEPVSGNITGKPSGRHPTPFKVSIADQQHRVGRQLAQRRPQAFAGLPFG